jgi:hypothetical protein
MFFSFHSVVLDLFCVLCVTTMYSMCLRYVIVVGKDLCLFYVFVCIIHLVHFLFSSSKHQSYGPIPKSNKT